jgi:inosine-uridine nucleoside N-ribohydrolase
VLGIGRRGGRRAASPSRHALVVRVHLDTDLGGDPDDACALAMLLGWPGIELVGVTTTIDPGGRRAGCVAELLEIAGRSDIPVVAGAEASLTTLRSAWPVRDGDERYWPRPVQARPSGPGAALDLLGSHIEQGATLVAIGPYTNLALLEVARPGSLGGVPIAVMGGWLGPPQPGLPAWGPEMDFNVQCDTRAVELVAGSGASLTLATLPVTLKAHLRARDLARLRASGPLGQLLARQTEAHAAEHKMAGLGRAHPALPDDLLNFHYDPVACAVAVGWAGGVVDEMRLRPVLDDAVLRFEPAEDGSLTRVVVDIDPADFTETWLTAIETAQQA